MVHVKLWGSLRALTDGRDGLDLDAKTIGEVLDHIKSEYPALRPQIARGVSFAVDGVIYRDDKRVVLGPENEIVMMPRMVGG